MQGELAFNKKEYHFSFDEKTFELTIYGLSGIVFSEVAEMPNDIINYNDVLEANCSSDKYRHIKFVVKSVLCNYIDKVLIKILYYVESNREVIEFDAMSFTSDELNSFYDIKNSFEADGFMDDGQIEVRVKKFNEVNKEYVFNNDDNFKNLTLNYYRQLHFGKTEILTIFTEMQLRFKVSQDIHQIFEHYYLIYNFFRFITYRKNISFNSIKLKVLRDEGKYESIGQLKIFIDYDNFYIEEDKVKKENQIKEVYIKEKITKIIDLIKSGRLYMDHFPESSADKQKITPSRFLMVTAAFEWECKEVYGDYKYNENESFKFVTDLIYNILENEKENLTGNRKKYLNRYQRSFKYTGVSLAEKIQYTLKDNDEVLSDFIESLYKTNHIDRNEYTYNKIAERVGNQRNNYAHGQIDREMNALVILDFIVLEWLLYAIRLKQLNFDKTTSKKIINELFGRHFHIK